MDVLELDERIARRMVGKINAGVVLFQLFVAGFRGSQRVVAVADGKDHRGSLETDVFFAHGCGVLDKCLVELVHVLALDEPAGDVSAAFHEVEVVDFFQAVLLRADWLNELLVVVVAEHQHVGQLNGSVAADSLAGRNALGNRALGGTDGRGCAGVIVIRIEVDHADKTFADGTVLERSFDVDVAVGIDREDAFVDVFLHRGVDFCRVRGFFFGAEFGFGKNQVDRGDSALGVLSHAVPVALIGRELVAGDDCPLFHMVGLRQQNVSG